MSESKLFTITGNAPDPQPREKSPVRCGRCGNNGTGIRNPECTSRVHDEERAAMPFIPGSRFRAEQFTDDALAEMVDGWKDEQ